MKMLWRKMVYKIFYLDCLLWVMKIVVYWKYLFYSCIYNFSFSLNWWICLKKMKVWRNRKLLFVLLRRRKKKKRKSGKKKKSNVSWKRRKEGKKREEINLIGLNWFLINFLMKFFLMKIWNKVIIYNII